MLHNISKNVGVVENFNFAHGHSLLHNMETTFSECLVFAGYLYLYAAQ